jgi:membrane-bound lytic murein transglycosylase B
MTDRFKNAIILIAMIAQFSPAFAKKHPKKPTATAITVREERLATAATMYAHRPEAMAFADDLAERRDLDREAVRAAMAQARRLPQVERLILPPPTAQAKNWRAYRARFIEPVRVAAGLRFWRAHADTLARAEAETGVPAEIIVGILGVETIWGQQMGTFRVIDTLATLAFDFPAAHPRAAARQAFFRDELEQFLTRAQRTGTDPLQPRGSYAGAMGMPQFMPSSVAKYAVDFDGDGTVDLNTPADAIGSVAHYLRAFGWKPGVPTHFQVELHATPAQLDALLAPDILPSFSAARLAELGATPEPAAQSYGGPLALVELQNGGDAPSYVLGTENFYAITRYNWSSYYAMAVIELGLAVRKAWEAHARSTQTANEPVATAAEPRGER